MLPRAAEHVLQILNKARSVQEFVGKLLDFGAVHWSPVLPEFPNTADSQGHAASLYARDRALAIFGPHVSSQARACLLCLMVRLLRPRPGDLALSYAWSLSGRMHT